MEKAHILFVDDEQHNLTAFKSAFRRNYEVHLANSATEGVEILSKEPIRVIITDQRMPDVTGVEFLEKIYPNYPDIIRMILTGFADVEAIIAAINKGQVYRYITKPWNKDELKVTIDNALEAYKLREENKNLIQDLQLANEGLEKKVKERTQEIEAINASLKEVLETVEKQRDDILASINYAQRIQEAILPMQASMQRALPKHFVLYMPRDIVSGDFYWFEEIEHKQFIIAADCTGHGVPGAFMTMLGMQALTNIIVQNNIHSPDQILNTLDEVLHSILRSESSLVRDGMDIVVVVIDKAKKELHFAGAKNPLMLVQQGKLQEIKGDIYSINGHRQFDSNDKTVRFTCHTFDVAVPTAFYMYSDGYQDQFGGKRNRKFMKKRLRELLSEISPKPMDTQKKVLQTTINDWMAAGEGEQIDDIVVIGVRLQG